MPLCVFLCPSASSAAKLRFHPVPSLVLLLQSTQRKPRFAETPPASNSAMPLGGKTAIRSHPRQRNTFRRFTNAQPLVHRITCSYDAANNGELHLLSPVWDVASHDPPRIFFDHQLQLFRNKHIRHASGYGHYSRRFSQGF